MKSTILLSAFSLVSVVTAIWPIPAAYEHGDKLLWISKDVGFYYAEKDQAVSINRGNNFQKILQRRYFELVEWWRAAANASSAQQEDQGMTCHDIVAYAVEQTWTNIFAKNFVPWKFHKRSWKEPDKEKEYYDTELRRVRLELLQENQQDPAKLEVDESYSIHLPEKGEAKITANTSVGIARGLNTFSQLFVAHSQGGAYTTLAPVTIFDAPVFQHRGLNLDVARQWFSVADIKRTIDAAAFNKMNRFHLHITDSQSWPLKIPSLPKLAAKGAHRPDMVYTVADFREIQRHAAIQGVQLITEIDMPGHTSAIWYSQPELIAAFDVQPDWRTYAAEPPSGTLKLNSSAVDRFLEAVLGDLLPRVRPWSGYFHTGGDEVNLNAYELDETVKSKDPQVLQPLMQRFIDRNHDRVRRAGLTPIVWEEMLLTWNLTLGEDVVVQSWRGDDAVKQIVEKGHKALVGNYKFWYLDCGKGQWLDFDPSIASSAHPYEDYCAPYHNWRAIYSYDPLANIPRSHHHLIIGGEAHMWSEQTDPVNLDRMVWPRAAAAAEILWSGAKDGEGRNRSQIEASPRLAEMRERLVAQGIGAEPVQMPYCTMEGVVCQLGYTPDK